MSEINQTTVNGIVDWIKMVVGNHGITLGVSGGKDSSVALALCAKAVGPEKVQAVLLPNGIQRDINDSEEICKFVGVTPTVINIGNIYKDFCGIADLDDKSKSNLAPRIRMTVLYALAQTNGNRVCGTGNLCERFVGWCTKWGDTACDFNPLGNFTVSEVIKIGRVLGLPSHLIEKAPADGITGKTDEENLGVSYNRIEDFIDNWKRCITTFPDEIDNKICSLNIKAYHKLNPIPMYEYDRSIVEESDKKENI